MTDDASPTRDGTVERRSALESGSAGQEYRTIVRASMDGFWKVGPNGRILDCNEAACAMLGYSREEMLSLFLHDVDTFEDEAAVAEHMRLVIAQGHDRFETRHRRKDGSSIEVEVSAYCAPGAEAPLLFAFSRDISSRQALRHSEARYRAVVEDQTDLIVRFRPDGTLTFANAAACRLAGRTAAELVGCRWHALAHPHDLQPLVHPDDLPMILAEMRNASPDKPVVAIEVRFRADQGRQAWFQFFNRAFFNAAGELVEVQSVGRDITPLRQAESALRSSEAQIRSILRATPLGIGLLANRVFREVNEAFVSMTGYSEEELIGRSARMLYPTDEDFEHVGWEKYRQIGEHGIGRVETRFLTKDGRIIHVALSSAPVVRGDLSQGVTFAAQDITLFKHAEQTRLAHEARQRNALVREVHHRIKNHLQGVSGMLQGMVREHPEGAQLLEQAIARVRAISQVYGLQSSCEDARVRLCELLHTAVDHMAGPVSIVCNLPPPGNAVVLAPEEAVPLALVVNELLTNAVKHLAAVDPQRPVRVALDIGERSACAEIRSGPAWLPPGFDFARLSETGTGLELVAALLPPQGSKLEFGQEGDEVVARLKLEAPAISAFVRTA